MGVGDYVEAGGVHEIISDDFNSPVSMNDHWTLSNVSTIIGNTQAGVISGQFVQRGLLQKTTMGKESCRVRILRINLGIYSPAPRTEHSNTTFSILVCLTNGTLYRHRLPVGADGRSHHLVKGW